MKAVLYLGGLSLLFFFLLIFSFALKEPSQVPWHQRGQQLFQSGNHKAALRMFQRALQEKSSPELWHDLALTYFTLKDFPKALQAIEKAISQKEKPKYLLLRGQIYTALLQWKKAEEDLKRAALPESSWHLAKLYWWMGQESKARKWLAKLPSSSPLRLYLLGKIYWENGEANKALLCFSHTPLLKAKLWECRILYHLGQFQKALHILEDLPPKEEVLKIRWEGYTRLGEFQNAKTLLSRLPPLYTAYLEMYQGNWQKALEVLQGKTPLENLWKGVALVFLKQPKEALKIWAQESKKLKKDLSSLSTKKALETLLSGAKIRISPLLGREWENDYLFFLGLHYYLRGKTPLALKTWKKGLSRSPQREHPFYLLRQALHQFSR